MPCDPPSLSSRTLPTRAAFEISGLLVIASLALAGCASMELPASFVRTSARESLDHSAVRSQDNGQNFDWDTETQVEPVFADYGKMQSRFSSPSETSQANSDSVVAPGHSFAQPKARLGRPIMMADQSVAEGRTDQVVDDTSKSTVAGPKPLDASTADTRRKLDRSPWASEGRPAWQPMRSTPQSITTKKQKNPADAVPNAERTEVPRPANDASTSPDPSMAPLDANAEVGGKDPMPESLESEDSGESSPIDASSTDPAAGAADESTPQPESGMLSRLRSLYAPRLVEDNTNKVRKQLRNWSDPFNPFRGKDEPETPPAAGVASSEQEGSKTADATTTTVGATPSVESPLAVVIQNMEQELQEWPKSTSGKPERLTEWRQRQTDLRLLYMVSGRSAEAVRIIDSLPEEEQEFWQSLMMSMNQYRASGSDSTRADQLTESLDSLRTAARKLQPLSRLAVRRLMFCDRIDGFGNVNAFPTSDFNPGQRVLVYAEIQNFTSELTADGNYRSEFAALIEFMKEGDDEVVETIRLPQILDHCDVERTDYFQSFELTLPALEGAYVVRIRLRDKLGLQTSDSQLKFDVRSQNSGL